MNVRLALFIICGLIFFNGCSREEEKEDLIRRLENQKKEMQALRVKLQNIAVDRKEKKTLLEVQRSSLKDRSRLWAHRLEKVKEKKRTLREELQQVREKSVGYDVITLTNGKKLTGKILEYQEGRFTLESRKGKIARAPYSKIKKIEFQNSKK